jgi:hypothetical protein
MKKLIVYILSLAVCIAVKANPGPVPGAGSAKTVAESKMLVRAGAIRFQFNKLVTTPEHTDSVLVIFDRYDHTGAGVIYQLYAADNEQGIDVSNVPAGKYYVTIRFAGLHRDQIEKVITIKSQKNEKVRIALDDTEAFSKNDVVIPAYRPDFSDLTVRK